MRAQATAARAPAGPSRRREPPASSPARAPRLPEIARGALPPRPGYFEARLGDLPLGAPGGAAEREARALAAGGRLPRPAPPPPGPGPLAAALGPGEPLALAGAAGRPALGEAPRPRTVRIHTGPGADRLARAAGARALTDGRSIAFRRGAFDPASPAGRGLLAHELAHVALGHGAEGRLHRDEDGRAAVAGTGVVMGAGGAAGSALLGRYPMLAAALRPAEWTILASAAGAREGTLPEGAPLPRETSLSIPLARLLDPASRAEATEVWPAAFALLRRGGPREGVAAGLLLRNEILRRFQAANGLNPAEERVEIALRDPLACGLPGPSELDFRFRGQPLVTEAGAVTAAGLDAALEGVRLEQMVREVAAEARALARVAGLAAQADAFDERVPAFDARVRADFRQAVRREVEAFRAAAAAAETESAAAEGGAAGGFAAGLAARHAAHARTLQALLADLDAWRLAHPRGLTLSEIAERNTQRVAELDPRPTVDLMGMPVDPAADAALFEALVNLLGGRTQRDIAEAYDRGEISMAEMEDLRHCAAARTAAVVAVGIALTFATAGLGAAVAGGLGLGAGGIAAGAVGGAVEGGVVVLGTMGTEHLLTAVRGEYRNPGAQAIWGRGAHAPEEYLLAGGAAMAGGAALGAGASLFGRLGAPAALPAVETAEQAALRARLREAFGELGQMSGAADAAKINDALAFIRAMPEGPDRTLLLQTHEIVARSLASPEQHAAVAMAMLAEAEREGLTLAQLIARQRQAAAEIEALGGAFQGLGVGSADPRAVYSRALIRLADREGLPVTVVPRGTDYGDTAFFEQVVARHPTLFDEGIDLVHGHHAHAFQDLVVTRGLREAGVEMNAFEFRQLLGRLQQAGQGGGRLTGVGAPAIRQDQIGQLLWEAHYDTAAEGAAYIGRPEYITAVLRKVLGYID